MFDGAQGKQADGAGYWDSGAAPQQLRGLTQRDHSYFDLSSVGAGQGFSQGYNQGFGRALSPLGNPPQGIAQPGPGRGLTPAEEVAAIMRQPESDETLAAAAAAQTLNPRLRLADSVEQSYSGLALTAAAVTANNALQQEGGTPIALTCCPPLPSAAAPSG